MPAIDIKSLVNASRTNPPAPPTPNPPAPPIPNADPASQLPPISGDDTGEFTPTPEAESVEGMYYVQMKDNHGFAVGPCEDRLDAIERYKAKCGILTTVHNFDVRKATQADIDESERGELARKV